MYPAGQADIYGLNVWDRGNCMCYSAVTHAAVLSCGELHVLNRADLPNVIVPQTVCYAFWYVLRGYYLSSLFRVPVLCIFFVFWVSGVGPVLSPV